MMNIVTVTPSLRPSMWKNSAENIVRQKRRPDISLLIPHRTRASAADWIAAVASCGSRPVVREAQDHYELSDVLRWGYELALPWAPGGIICTMDDDDYYGEGYLEELEAFFEQHPDGAIYGKQNYWCRWMEGKHKDQLISAGSHPEPFRAANVAGPTIAVPAAAWAANPKLRHPAGSLLHADSGLISAAHALGLPIYTTSPDNFFLQRYPAGHGHGWNMPQPKE